MTTTTSRHGPRTSDAAATKWQQVLADIEAQFEAGAYQHDQSFPTLGQLSQTYGVSDITARRVFRELKTQGRIITRGRHGTFVRVPAAAAASKPKAKQTLLLCQPQAWLGTVVSESEALFLQAFYDHFHRQGLENAFELRTITVEFCIRNPEAIANATLFVMMESLLKVQGNTALVDPERLAFFQSQGKAIVFRSLLHAIHQQTPPLHQVCIDLRQGVNLAAEHLIAQGHKRLAMITGSLSNLWFKPRFEGFLDALAHHGLPCDPACIKTTKGLDPQQDFDAMDKLMALSPRPTAIVCANDTRALHVIEYCKAKGLGVPDDIAITGFDNSLESSLVTPGLTTVDQQHHKLIEAMFEMATSPVFLSGKQPPQTHIIQPRIIERRSSVI